MNIVSTQKSEKDTLVENLVDVLNAYIEYAGIDQLKLFLDEFFSEREDDEYVSLGSIDGDITSLLEDDDDEDTEDSEDIIQFSAFAEVEDEDEDEDDFEDLDDEISLDEDDDFSIDDYEDDTDDDLPDDLPDLDEEGETTLNDSLDIELEDDWEV